jgi:hypothetical protein
MWVDYDEYQILMISDNVEFLPRIFMSCFGSHFENAPLIAPLMVTYHYVKFYVSIIIQLEVININVRNFKFPKMAAKTRHKNAG